MLSCGEREAAAGTGAAKYVHRSVLRRATADRRRDSRDGPKAGAMCKAATQRSAVDRAGGSRSTLRRGSGELRIRADPPPPTNYGRSSRRARAAWGVPNAVVRPEEWRGSGRSLGNRSPHPRPVVPPPSGPELHTGPAGHSPGPERQRALRRALQTTADSTRSPTDLLRRPLPGQRCGGGGGGGRWQTGALSAAHALYSPGRMEALVWPRSICSSCSACMRSPFV